MTPTIELLRSHRSIRHFTDAPVSDEQRAAIIASAQAASTSSFLQCTSIIRITDPALRERLVPLTGGQQHVAQAAEFWVFCADFNRHLQICPQAQLAHYYLSRGSNARRDTWSDHIRRTIVKESRPFILDYLHKQGWATR